MSGGKGIRTLVGVSPCIAFQASRLGLSRIPPNVEMILSFYCDYVFGNK